MRQVRAGRRRPLRRSQLDEEPDEEQDTEFCDPVIRQARKQRPKAREREDEGSGRTGDRT